MILLGVTMAAVALNIFPAGAGIFAPGAGGGGTGGSVTNISANSTSVFTNVTTAFGSTNDGNLSVNIAGEGPQYIFIGTNIVGKNPGGVGADIAMPQNSGIFWESAAGHDGFYYNSHHDGLFRGRPTVSGTGGIDLLFTGGGLQIGAHGGDHSPVFLVEDAGVDSTHINGFSKMLAFTYFTVSNGIVIQPQGLGGPVIKGYPITTNGPVWSKLVFYSLSPLFTTTGQHDADQPGFEAFETASNGLTIPANREIVFTNSTLKLVGGSGSAIKMSKNGDPSISGPSFDWTIYENNSGDFNFEHTHAANIPIQIADFNNELDLQLGISAPVNIGGSTITVSANTTTFNKNVGSSGGKPNAVTIGASPFVFVNNTTANLECYFSSTSVAYSVSKNGAAVYPSLVGDDYLILQPTNSVSITYVATPPTVFTNAW